jgi:CysZ protein
MQALIVSLFSAMRSLLSPGMFGLLVLTITTTIASLLGFVGITTAICEWFTSHGHGSTYLPFVGALGSGILAWFLFPGIMPIVVYFFNNRIASTIEQRNYPATPVHVPSFWSELWHDARFSVLTVVLNILALPLYLFPVINLVLFYVLNGYLLGREFFVMAARRHIPINEAEAMRKRHARPIMLAGMLLTVLATIPVVNLFAPLWGIAVMVHMYHRLKGTPVSHVLPPG